MSKWDIIRKISERGDAYGKHGGVLDLLEQTGKSNTQEVTEAEAERFYREKVGENNSSQQCLVFQ